MAEPAFSTAAEDAVPPAETMIEAVNGLFWIRFVLAAKASHTLPPPSRSEGCSGFTPTGP